MKTLMERPPDLKRPIVAVTHHYPPIGPVDASDVALVLFPWEESLVPPDLLQKLEAAGDAVLATSSFVKKVLIDSGLRRPVFAPLQTPDLSDFLALAPALNWPRDEQSFVFFHLSSCFPRKGVDGPPCRLRQGIQPR